MILGTIWPSPSWPFRVGPLSPSGLILVMLGLSLALALANLAMALDVLG